MCTGVEPSSGVRVTLVNRVGASLCDPGALPGAGRRAGPWLHPLWARLPGQFLSHRRLPRPALSWLPGLLLIIQKLLTSDLLRTRRRCQWEGVQVEAGKQVYSVPRSSCETPEQPPVGRVKPGAPLPVPATLGCVFRAPCSSPDPALPLQPHPKGSAFVRQVSGRAACVPGGCSLGRGSSPGPWGQAFPMAPRPSARPVRACAHAHARVCVCVCVRGALQPGRVSCPPVSAEQFASYWFAAVLSMFWISALS